MSSLIIFWKSHPSYAYCGFVPLIISRPTLKLDDCSLPINAVQTSFVYSCAHKPLIHKALLEWVLFVWCPCKQSLCPIYHSLPCMCWYSNPLSLYVNNYWSSFSWLLNHPNLKFRCLELTCYPAKSDELRGVLVRWRESRGVMRLKKRWIETSEVNQEHEFEDVKESTCTWPTKGWCTVCMQLCEFICKLGQQDELNVHFSSVDTFSSLSRQGIESMCSLPTLTALSFHDTDWENIVIPIILWQS